MMKVHSTAKVVAASIGILLLLIGGFETASFLKRSPAHSLAAPELTVDTAAKAAPVPAHPAASQRDGTFSAGDFNALPSKDRFDFAMSAMDKHDAALANFNCTIEERMVDIELKDGASHFLQKWQYAIRRLNENILCVVTVHPPGKDAEDIQSKSTIAWNGKEFRGLGVSPKNEKSLYVGRVDANDRWSIGELKCLNVLGLRGLKENYFSGTLARWIERERNNPATEVEAKAIIQGNVEVLSITARLGPRSPFTLILDPNRDFMVTKIVSKLEASAFTVEKTLEVTASTRIDGTWVPKRIVEKVIDSNKDFEQQSTFDFQDFSIGDVKDDDVRLDFPPGTLVTDSIKRINYVINPDGTFLLNPVAVPSEGIVRIPMEQQVAQIDDAARQYRETAIVDPQVAPMGDTTSKLPLQPAIVLPQQSAIVHPGKLAPTSSTAAFGVVSAVLGSIAAMIAFLMHRRRKTSMRRRAA